MSKVRIHSEWFMSMSKTSCPCGERKTSVYAWGQYVHGRWRTIEHFCRVCFESRVIGRIMAHAEPCGCVFKFNVRSGNRIPDWIRLPSKIASKAA